MVPLQAPATSVTILAPVKPIRTSTTFPNFSRNIATDRSLLTPEDAIYQGSPPRKQSAAVNKLQKDLRMTNGVNGDLDVARLPRRRRHKDKDRGRSGNRRRKGTWKKLLWVKQSYPDNYTDQDTFLEHLQRNPRLQPYDFWPLVADSTVIVQHVCSVIIFIVCFVGIFQERVSPFAVVAWGSTGTLLGWLLWDWWVSQEESIRATSIPTSLASTPPDVNGISATSSTTNVSNPSSHNTNGSAHGPSSHLGALPHYSHSTSVSSLHSSTSQSIQTTASSQRGSISFNSSKEINHHTSLRLSTVKSAFLICFTLLGLSPILKSLTRSTSSDSIWTLSLLLFTINIFFFEYGSLSSSPTSFSSSASLKNKNIPASLSTNAALMASTVLASRLPSTGQVFSLTLFSIEVFGLFPVFRRYARQESWRLHLTVTGLLVLGASGGVGLILGDVGDGWRWKNGLVGLLVGAVITSLAMGGCSWWLIGLQKYKNEIHGPWDPARPIIRRTWDDY